MGLTSLLIVVLATDSSGFVRILLELGLVTFFLVLRLVSMAVPRSIYVGPLPGIVSRHRHGVISAVVSPAGTGIREHQHKERSDGLNGASE